MKRKLQFIQHKGKEIVLFDFSGCQNIEEIMPVIQDAREWFQGRKHNSVLTLTDVTGAHYDTEILNLLKEFTLHNKPYVKAGAIVGITRPLMKLAYNIVMTFSKRNLPVYDSRDQALNWLIEQ